MDRNGNGKRSGGFTLIETLLVIAILVILLGLSLVGVAYYRDYLKITELDNEAREIYMAAENRAVLLQNSGESASLLSLGESGTVEMSRTELALEANSDLLPKGTIDPALWSGDFCVVYDKMTGHVKEVFYAEKTFGKTKADLEEFSKDRSHRVSLFRGGNTLVGYYGSDVGDPIGTKPLPTPGVEVLIENGEELTLTVKYTMPEGLSAGVAVDRAPKVTLEYGGEEIDLWASARKTGGPDITLPETMSAEYIWTLDSLESEPDPTSGEPTFPKQFRGLISGSPGGNFTVTASLKLTAGDDWIPSSYYATGTDNSLFAKESTANTAKIANLRHLQNLHPGKPADAAGAFGSGAGSFITAAEQLSDIDCGKYCKNDGAAEPDSAYKFTPITNENLSSYDGQNKHICNLSTTTGSAAAGLFGTVSSNLEVRNTRVCWTDPTALVKNGNYIYAVSGTNAGGLIGSVTGGAVTIENSFAATTVKGAAAGGLVGSKTGSGTLTIKNSYADCYLRGTNAAGGLIGAGSASLTNCYAAGFIMPGSAHTAGLAGGTGANAANCYSAVRVILADGSLESPATPLYGSMGNGSGNVLYLSTAAEATADLFGSAFEYDSKKPETHAYDLRRRLDGTVEKLTPPYPFPGLNGLPHYGDWAELDSIPAGLVYYEIYDDGTTGVSGITEDGAPFDTLKEIPPVQDGYALIIKKEDAGSLNRVLIKYEDRNLRLKRAGPNWMWHPSGGDPKFESISNSGDYTLLLLPEDIVTGELPNPSRFYQKLVVGEGQDAVTYWFNPHFAKTVHTGEAIPGSPTSPGNPVYVRTPRHFYDMSRFQDNYVNKSYSFRQELDLDYAAYSWYGSIQNQPVPPAAESKSTSYKQLPIGRGSSTFRGTYDGGCHTIKNVFFKTGGASNENLGLFAVIHQKGILKNIVYELDPKSSEEVDGRQNGIQSCGALVGWMQGKIENCAVYGVNMHILSGEIQGIGGLVGYISGTVTGCSVEVVSLKTTGGYPGGLAGSNSGTVENCYAVGKIDSDKHASGLINESNDGKITNCYAAVWVEAQVKRGLCNQSDKVTNSGFLTGAFKYRGEMYIVNSSYQAGDSLGAGERILPAELAEKIKVLPEVSATVHYDISRESWKSDYEGDGKEDFPYRTGVKDAGSQPVHYGLWPVEYMPPAGLAYYETYSDGTFGVSGQYENTKIMSLKTATVAKDGYALVFDGEFPAEDYKVKYGKTVTQSWTLTKTNEGKYVWSGPATQEVEAIKADVYTLIPLPDKIVTGELSEGDVIGAKFYQRLVYGEGLLHSRTFYFNPHFAGRIKEGELVSVEAGSVKSNAAYTPPVEPGKPGGPVEPVSSSGRDGSIAVWAGTCTDVENAWGWRAVSVRTARHFYALSRFQNTYVVEGSSAKRYYFKQALDVDYNTYGWYGEEQPAKHSTGAYYVQAPIGQGTGDDGFKGAYNGDGHTIRNVFYTTGPSKEGSYRFNDKSLYAGLFRYVEYIWNVNYAVPDNVEVTLANNVTEKNNVSDLVNGVKVGTLIGGCFRSLHCNATMKDFTVKCDGGTHIFIGGLAGYSNKMNGCSVEITGRLKYDGKVPTVYVGGLQALVYQEVVNCTSKVNSLVVNGAQGVGSQALYAGGLLGGIAHDAIKNTTRAVAGCATVIQALELENGGNSYAGGLIGRNCEGGAIYGSYAVGAIGAGDNSPNHHYSGLVGQNESGTGSGTDSGTNYPTAIRNCYSAVGLPAGSENRNYNFCPTNPGAITNCYYLTGTWVYKGKSYTSLPNATNYAVGKNYDDLAKLTLPEFSESRDTPGDGGTRHTTYNIPNMSATGTGYPFPVNPVNPGKKIVGYVNGKGEDSGKYVDAFLPYPGGEWPVKK